MDARIDDRVEPGRVRPPRRVPFAAHGVVVTSVMLGVAGLVFTTQAQIPPTYHADVAPIIAEQCAPCHREGGGAPFTLGSYEDLARRSGAIDDVVQTGEMPPWLPAQGSETFLGARSLSAAQKRIITDWIAAGLPRGEAHPDQERSTIPTSSGASDPQSAWSLGLPNLVVGSSPPVVLEAEGDDVYRTLVISVPIDRVQYVRGLEFRTTAPAVVHHAVIGLDRTGTSRWMDARDPAAGFDGRMTGPSQSPDGHFLGWTPGRRPTFLPEGLAWRLDPGTDLVVQLHLVPSEARQSITVRLGLYFSPEPPARHPVLIRIGSTHIDMPAGERRYRTDDEYVLPVDVEALAIYPHAHLLAREIRAWAELPDGGVRELLRINRWIFEWQDEYRYVSAPALPRGTRVRASFVYDNSSDNPANPADPPRRVLYGPRTSDEMGDVWIQVLARSRADRAALVRDMAVRNVEASIAGYEGLIRARPEDAEHHLTLGTLYEAQGRRTDAAARFREAVRLDPGATVPQYNLAVVLQAGGEIAEAKRLLDRVVAREPENAQAWHALGHIALAQNDPEAAQLAFERALKEWSGFADAHNSLANLFVRLGRPAEAEREYRLAIEASPEHLPALNNLAVLLAKRGAAEEAVALLERALAIDNSYAPTRQNLAAARETLRNRRRP